MIDLEKMSETFKWVGVSVSVIALGAGAYHYGYTSASDKYTKIIAEKDKANADAVTQAEEASRAKEREDAEKIAQALAERDKALSDAATLRSTAVRVRDAADTRAKSDLQIARDTGDRTQERLAQCESLLGEGAELVGEGAELLTRVAADKDVVNSANR